MLTLTLALTLTLTLMVVVECKNTLIYFVDVYGRIMYVGVYTYMQSHSQSLLPSFLPPPPPPPPPLKIFLFVGCLFLTECCIYSYFEWVLYRVIEGACLSLQQCSGRTVRVQVPADRVSTFLTLAVQAAVDWVYYESEDFVRLSVIPDSKSL